MARSLRSKRARNNRRVLRQKYGKRELEVLKRVVAQSSDLENLVTVVPAEQALKSAFKSQTSNAGSSESSDTVPDKPSSNDMETDDTPRYNKRTLRNQHGSYPPWMTKKAIKRKKYHKKCKKSFMW